MTLIDCETFYHVPNTCCRKFRMWLLLLTIIIFSPLLSIYVMIKAFYEKTEAQRLAYFNEHDNNICCLIINILVLPWNILVFGISFSIALAFGVVVMIAVMPMVIYKNSKQFCYIMKYWSSKNRFRGKKWTVLVLRLLLQTAKPEAILIWWI